MYMQPPRPWTPEVFAAGLSEVTDWSYQILVRILYPVSP